MFKAAIRTEVREGLAFVLGWTMIAAALIVIGWLMMTAEVVP